MKLRLFARRRATVGVGALALVAGGIAFAQVAQAAPVTIKDIVLGVGARETQRYVTWYTSESTDSVVQLERTKDLNAGAFDADAVSYPAAITPTTGSSGGDIARSPFRGSALLDNLDANADYSYRVLASDGSDRKSTRLNSSH